MISLVHFKKRGDALITTWDVYGYWVYLPAAFTYGDLKEFDFAEEHFENYEIASQLFQLADTDNGRVPVYTSGLAILWTPAYLCAETVARFGRASDDGLSPPYQYALIFTCLLWGYLGLFVLRKFLLRYFPDLWVAVALIAIVFGTNLFHYFCHSPGMPHAYLFTCHALILYLTERWVRLQRTSDMIIGGVVLCVACLIRPTEALMVIIPMTYVLANRNTINWSGRVVWQILAALGAALVVLLPQLILWKMNTGSWLFNAYADAGHEFHFDGRYLFDGLFSYRKGWLLYTPLMFFAIVGLVFVRGKAVKWRLVVLLTLLAYVFITFSWHWWWYANSFGARAMIHIYPELSIGLVALLSHLSTRRKAIQLPMLIAIGFTIPLNLFQTWQYNHKILPGDAINGYYFWRAFGRTEVPRNELKYLFIPNYADKDECRRQELGNWVVNTPQDMDSSRQQGFQMQDRTGAYRMTPSDQYSDAIVVVFDEASADSLSGRWIEMSSELWLSSDQFNSMRNAVYSIEVRRGDEVLLWQPLNFQIYQPQKVWTKDRWEYQLPENLEEGDVFKYFIWNRNSPDTIYIHSLGVELLSCD